MKEASFRASFGSDLKFAMKSAKVSQRELALRSGLNQSTISRYINGEQIPTLTAFINITNALECEPDELVNFYETIE